MTNKYKDSYYDHFAREVYDHAIDLEKEKNYMMRFSTSLDNHVFKENNLTIIFFKEGAGAVVKKNETVKIAKNKFIIANSGTSWEYVNEKEENIDVLGFVVNEEFRKQFDFFESVNEGQLLDTPHSISENPPLFMEAALNADYYPSGELLKKIHHASGEFGFSFLSAEELTMELLQQLYKDQKRANGMVDKIQVKKKSTREETFKRLLVAYEYIHDNITKPISLDELSYESSLSKYHLYESFKNIYGKTPHQYINKLKIFKSREYIRKGELTISEISDYFGFNDLPVFSKIFKKVYGYPPSHYQN